MNDSRETEALWSDFRARLFAYLRVRVATADDAEDLLQDVFLRIHTNLHRLSESRSVASWVYRIASNVIADYHRERGRTATGLTELARVGPGGAGRAGDDGTFGEDVEASADLARCIEPLVEKLPEKYGDAIRLTDLGGVSRKEVARQLGLSDSGMKSRVQRGRSKLKDLLLDCCDVEVDRRGRVIDYERRGGGGGDRAGD